MAGYTYGIVGEKISDEDTRLAALSGDDLLAAARKYLSRPTVVGHLTPNESPPRGNSQKSSAEASDDFSKRIPNGPIVQPEWIAKAMRTPTTARSVLSPVEFTLSNGLRVIVQTKSDRPTFVLRGDIASSPAFEPPGKEGIARLASSVADYGSEGYPFAQRRKATDEMGAFVTDRREISRRKGVASEFDRIVPIIADGEEHPTFADPWLDVERSQLANSLQSESNISGVVIDRAYERLLLATDDPTLRQPTSQSVGEDYARRPRRVYAALLATRSHHDRGRRRSLARNGAHRAGVGIRRMASQRAETRSAPYADAAGDRAVTSTSAPSPTKSTFVSVSRRVSRSSRRLRYLPGAQPDSGRRRRL